MTFSEESHILWASLHGNEGHQGETKSQADRSSKRLNVVLKFFSNLLRAASRALPRSNSAPIPERPPKEAPLTLLRCKESARHRLAAHCASGFGCPQVSQGPATSNIIEISSSIFKCSSVSWRPTLIQCCKERGAAVLKSLAQVPIWKSNNMDNGQYARHMRGIAQYAHTAGCISFFSFLGKQTVSWKARLRRLSLKNETRLRQVLKNSSEDVQQRRSPEER